MSRVLALVEGETEIAFVKHVLAPELAGNSVYLSPVKIGSARGQSGIRPYESNRRDIVAALKQRTNDYCTTMLDYYGMPDDWPGRTEAELKPFPEKALTVEQRLREEICRTMGSSFRADRFIPYVQMHEFEAILFSQPRAMAEVLQLPRLELEMVRILDECHSPEEIDDDPDTAPSKRIKALTRKYEKRAQAALVARRIGLATIRQKCPHFSEWVSRLETL